MGLKQAIVIKSEYTNNARSKEGSGSRGASPGQYVMRYMARENATEILAPVRAGTTESYNAAGFVRYMARTSATEQLKQKHDDLLQDADAYGSPLVLKQRFRQVDKLSGRAFGSRGVSLSHRELEQSSDVIQSAFDSGHSVQKIVLSFTEDYLRETGVLDPAFTHKGRGSYKGHIDQLKLRHAVMRGVENMTKSGGFVEPEWVGTIQLDTSHVHAHIALTDTAFSKSRMKSDGADRGKINELEKRMFRKGINHSLQDMRHLHGFYKQSSLERQNVVSFVKDYAYATLRENASVQLLIASLPKERKHWRFGTNRLSMRHPNTLARGIVESAFAEEPERSGYDAAMKSVTNYARESARKNKLSKEERQQLVTNGREKIIERSVNGLYAAIKTLDDRELTVRTPTTDTQSSSDAELIRAVKPADDDSFDMAAFTLRVRGYGRREESHASDAEVFYRLATEFDGASDAGLVDDTAHVMRLFYEEEQRYHMGLTDKYRTFLAFNHPHDVEQVEAMKTPYAALTERFEVIKSDEAETGLVLTAERAEYTRDLRAYTFDCFTRGVASLKEWESVVAYSDDAVETRFVLPVRPKTRNENLTPHYFTNVKALDVHHLGLDYYNQVDVRIDAKNAVRFANAYEARITRSTPAERYVNATGQSLPELTSALRDIREMEGVVDKAVDDGLIQTISPAELLALPELEERQLSTIRSDKSLDVAERVRQTLIVAEMDVDESYEELE